MAKNSITYAKIFSISLTKYSRVFELFDASLGKVISYFLLLNFLIFLPITLQVVTLEEPDYGRFGMTFQEDVPNWLPAELPTHCIIADQTLQCASTTVYEYEIMNRDTPYKIYLNATDETVVPESHAFVFKDTTFDVHINDSLFTFYYRGFDYIDFEDLHTMDQQAAADLLFESIFQSIKPTLILPIIIFFVGVLTLTNFILLLTLAGLSMLFSFNISNFPSYKNMLKLLIFASTIPSFINLILGFFGLSAFTSISYNLFTPIIAFFMFKQSQLKQEITSM